MDVRPVYVAHTQYTAALHEHSVHGPYKRIEGWKWGKLVGERLRNSVIDWMEDLLHVIII